MSSTVSSVSTRGMSPADQACLIQQLADHLCNNLPQPGPDVKNTTVLLVVRLPNADCPAEEKYFAGLDANGRLKDASRNALPTVMLVQGVRPRDGGDPDPTKLPGGKSALQLVNDADGDAPGSRYLDELYKCPARLIAKWDGRSRTVSVCLALDRPRDGARKPRKDLPMPSIQEEKETVSAADYFAKRDAARAARK